MAHNKKKIFEQTKEIIIRHKLYYIENIIAYLPCQRSTFYNLFPIDSKEYKEISELLYIIKKKNKSDIASNRVPENYNNKDGYLYLVHCEDTNYYKIGMSNSNYKNRLSSLQSGCPIKLHMLYAVHSLDYKNIEKKLHSKYKNNAHFGEWFIFKNNEIKDVINYMNEIVKKQLIIEFK